MNCCARRQRSVSQLRQLQLPGVPDFNTWRLEQAQTPKLALPEATTTVDVMPTATQEQNGQASIAEEEPVPLEPEAQPARKFRARQAVAPKQFDPKNLLPDFRGQSVQTVVQIVLAQEPDRSFGTDDVLNQVYGEFTDIELTKARRSLGKVLSIGAKDGLWQRVQDKPPLYQSSDSDAEPEPDSSDLEAEAKE